MEKRSVTILPGSCRLAEHARRDFVIDAQPGVTIEDLQKPETFVHLAEQFRVFDHLEVRAVDGSFVAQFIITGCGKNWAKLYKTAYYELSKAVKEVPDSPVTFEWGGPAHKWRIKRKVDNEVLERGFGSSEEAEKWWSENGKIAA
jgi:hypothetical protein